MILQDQSEEVLNAKVKVKELQHNENIQKSKNDLAKYRIDAKAAKEKRDQKVVAGILIGLAILFVFLMLFLWIGLGLEERKHNARDKELREIEEQVIEYIDEGDYDLAMIYANRLIMDDGFSSDSTAAWDQKREEYISIINTKINENVEATDIEIPISSKYAHGKNYEEIVTMLKDAGFTNISLSTLEDDAVFFTKTDEIEKITVDGRSTFDEGTEFLSNVKIIIYYYE